jgi:hypothetical protein
MRFQDSKGPQRHPAAGAEHASEPLKLQRG